MARLTVPALGVRHVLGSSVDASWRRLGLNPAKDIGPNQTQPVPMPKNETEKIPKSAPPGQDYQPYY